MLKNRRASRRAFTVETKAGGRGRAKIPTRAEPLVEPGPETSPLAAVAPDDPAPQPRRILPNLIEAEPEPVEAEVPAPRRRGRQPKARPVSPVPVAVPIVRVTSAPVPRALQAAAMPAKGLARLVTALPPGERWKHRLNRWSR